MKKKSQKINKKNSTPRPVKKAKPVLTPNEVFNPVDIIDSLPLGLVIFNENQVHYANPKAAEILKLSKKDIKEITSYTIYNFIAEQYHDRLRKNNKKIINGVEFPPVEFECIQKGGNKIAVEAKSKAILYQGKKAIQSVFYEITERRKAQKEIQEKNTDLSLVLDNIDEIVFYIDFRGGKKVKYVSKQIESILGFSPESYEKRAAKLIESCHPDDVPEILRYAKLLRETKKPQNFTYRFFNKVKGKYVWLNERIFPQLDSQKNLIGNFGVSRDVTAAKEAELLIKDSEEKFRLLSENALDIIFRFEFFPKPHYSYISPSIKKITGYSSDEFYKNANLSFSIVHPLDKELVKLPTESNKASKKQYDFSQPLDLRFITKAKKTIWVQTIYNPVRNKDGKIIALEGITREITKQKTIELSLADNERTLSTLLSNLPGMAYRCLKDKSWTMLFISEGCLDLTGYKPKEFLNNTKINYANIVHPEDRNIGIKEIEQAIKSKTSFEIEYRVITKTGAIKWVLEKGEGVFSENKLLFLEGFISDITQRKKNEAELSQKWLNYKSLIDSSPSGIIIHSEGKVLFANPAALAMVEATSLKGNEVFKIDDFLLPQYLELSKQRSARAFAGEKLDFERFKVRTLKGKIIDVEMNVAPIIYNGKEVLQTIVHDIGIQKQLEDERLRGSIAEEINKGLSKEIEQRKIIEKSLSDTKKFLRLIIDSSLDMIVVCNLAGKITEINPAALSTFGYSSDEIENTNVTSLFVLPVQAMEIFNRLLKKGENFSGEIQSIKKNGEMFTSYMSASVLKNENGVLVGAMGVLRDISQIKLDQQKLQESEEKYRDIFENSSDVIQSVDANGKILFVNSAWKKVMGYSDIELEALTIFDLLHQDGKNYCIRKFQQIAKGEKLNMIEIELINKLGNKVILEGNVSAKFESGKFISTRGLFRNVTELRKKQRQIDNQSSKIKAIFDSGNQLFWSINNKGQITSFNQNFEDVVFNEFGFRPEINANPSGMYPEDVLQFWNEKYGEVFKGNRVEFVLDTLQKNGQHAIRQNFLQPIYNEFGEVQEVAGIAYDITGLKDLEKKNVEQEGKLKAIFESGKHLIWTVNANYEITSFNRSFYKVVMDKYGKVPEINKRYEQLLSPDDAKEYINFWHPQYKSVFTGKATKIERRDVDSNGNEMYREVYLNPIIDPVTKNVVEVSCFSHDITDNKKYEDQILDQSSKLFAIFESGAHLIWTVDKNQLLTSYNKNFERSIQSMYGTLPELHQPIRRPSSATATLEYDVKWDYYYNQAFQGESVEFVSERTNLDGSKVFRQIYLSPIRNEKNEVNEIAGIALDISERVVAEEKIRQSLQEKEVLLKEVHHRVKNNLQVISSILNLQTSYVKEESTLTILKECQNRIKSMAFIHESLYQTKDFSEINFGEYIMTLVKNLIHSYVSVGKTIRYHFDIDPILLNLDLSIPCGLIVNELISNALKYAFLDQKEGLIFVKLKRENGVVSLVISDNGKGLAQNVDYRNTDTLGLQLVVTLAEQLGGTIELENNKGAKFTLEFKG